MQKFRILVWKSFVWYFPGKPDGLQNCSLLNQTFDSLQVECIEGFNGGLTQEFVMEVYDSTAKKLVTNVTSRAPYFSVGGLDSGLSFDIILFATNKKGRSEVALLQAYTLQSAEKHTGKPNTLNSLQIFFKIVPLLHKVILKDPTHHKIAQYCNIALS